MLKRIRPSGPAARARRELAADFIADLRRLDTQIRQTRNKLAAAVQASGTTLTEIFGVGPVIAAAVLGTAGGPSRFGNRDRFAAYNGTAPIEVASGDRKIHRLSLRGNRRLNHAIHMAAVTQIRHKHSPGRAYFDRKDRRGQDRQGSTPVPQAADQRRHLRPAQRRHGPPHARRRERPGRAIGERLCLQRGRLAPRAPALRTSHSRTSTQPTVSRPGPASSTGEATEELAQNDLTTKRSSLCTVIGIWARL
jgi:hypothetical protein